MELIIYLTNKIGQYYEKNKNYKKAKHFTWKEFILSQFN